MKLDCNGDVSASRLRDLLRIEFNIFVIGKLISSDKYLIAKICLNITLHGIQHSNFGSFMRVKGSVARNPHHDGALES